MNLRKAFHIIMYMLVTPVLFTSFSSMGACTLNTAVGRIDFPSVNLVPSEKGTIGLVLARQELRVPTIGYNCGVGIRSTWKSVFTRTGMGPTADPNIYSSGIPGIGIRVKWPATRATDAWVPGTFSCVNVCSEISDKVILEFIQTGNAESGIIPSGNLVTVNLSSENDSRNLTLLNINLGQVTVNVRSCSIYASDNQIDLGSFSVAEIQKAGSSFAAPKKEFSITLDCPNRSTAYIQFDGKLAWGMSDAILDNTGTAKSTFVKIYKKISRIYMDQNIGVSTLFAANFIGLRKVDYAAEMVFGDTAKVTAGTVSANLIYTLTIN